MKNNKGFTLVEIIAAITILSILMIITIPAISKIFTSSKNQISSLNKKNLEESAKMFAQEIFICDSSSDITDVLNIFFKKTNIDCKEARRLLKSSGITVTIGFLKEKEYFSDRSNNCNETGKVTVKQSVDDVISVELHPNIICK